MERNSSNSVGLIFMAFFYSPIELRSELSLNRGKLLRFPALSSDLSRAQALLVTDSEEIKKLLLASV